MYKTALTRSFALALVLAWCGGGLFAASSPAKAEKVLQEKGLTRSGGRYLLDFDINVNTHLVPGAEAAGAGGEQ